MKELWSRAQTQTKKVDMKRLLNSIPVFAGLPARAPENNLGQHARSKQDRFLRLVKQSLLHCLRVGAALAKAPSAEVGLQLWQYKAQLYFKISEERKELSVPGGRRQEREEELLFTKKTSRPTEAMSTYRDCV